MKYKNLCLITNESIKNMGSLRDYFIQNTQHFVSFHYPHGYLSKQSYVDVYDNGVHIFSRRFPKVAISSNTVKNFVYYVFINYVIFRYVPKNAFVIVDNPLFCVSSGLFRMFRRLRFIYWVGDYYPEVHGAMRLYVGLAYYFISRLPHVVFVSPPLKAVYARFVGWKSEFMRPVIGLGIKKRYVTAKKPKSKKTVLGFIGVIRSQQGLDLAFRYIKEEKHARLSIVGDGYWLAHYRALAKKMEIESRVTFYGYVEHPEKIIGTWDIGIALYDGGLNNLSRYAEPTKIKDYLSFGLPVITTKTTYFAKEVEKYKAGIVIHESPAALRAAVLKIRAHYSQYVRGVNTIMTRYEYTSWYDRKFIFLKTLPSQPQRKLIE